MGRSAVQSDWSPELNREDCEQRGRELGVVGSRLMIAVAGCVSRCDFAGGVSSCPSQDAVGEMLGGVRRESVNRAVRLLQESGQLAVRKARAPGARWAHNEYTLLVGCEVRQHRLPVLLWWESRRKRIAIEQWRLAHRSSRRCVPRRGACTTRVAASGSGVSHMNRTARGFEEGKGALEGRTGGTGALKVSTGGRVAAEFRDRPVENRIRPSDRVGFAAVTSSEPPVEPSSACSTPPEPPKLPESPGRVPVGPAVLADGSLSPEWSAAFRSPLCSAVLRRTRPAGSWEGL